MKQRLLTVAACLAVIAGAEQAPAQTAIDPATLKILDLLVQRQVISRADAEALLDETREEIRQQSEAVRIDYIPEYVKQEIKEDVAEQVVAQAKEERWAGTAPLPEWLDRFRFYGDVRVRGEANLFANTNALFPDFEAINDRSDGGSDGFTLADLVPLLNNTEDQVRLRARARLGVDIQVNRFTQAGLRIITAADDDPVSSNELLTGYFDDFIIGFDRAFIRVGAHHLIRNAHVHDLSFWAGKFENPFLATDILFDEDLSLDGAALTADADVLAGRLGVFGAGGAFPLKELSLSSDDQWLYAVQGGVTVKPSDRLSVKLAGAYYLFDNVQARLNEPSSRERDDTVPDFLQRGNTLFNVRNEQPAIVNTLRFGLAAEFEVVAATAQAALKLTDDLELSVTAEYLKNLALDETAFGFQGDPLRPDDNQQSTGDTAWQVALQVGHGRIEQALDWQVRAAYKELESDATVDAFVDSDFGRGGTNQEGFEVEGALGVGKNLWLRAKWLSARSLDIPGVVNDQFDVDTVQIDLNVDF